MLSLYDTRERAVVPIQPLRSGSLSIYACGPTVYRDAHIGNLRTFLLPDLIRRTALAQGLTVKIAQNITDVGHMLDDTGLGADSINAVRSGPSAGGSGRISAVDEGIVGEDRMLRAADDAGTSALVIARQFEDKFRRDCDALGIARPDFSPRASECIADMIQVIEQLLASGNAYVGTDGSVFFSAQSFNSYGAISGNRLDALRPGHRFEGTTDPAKRFHADWALWKSAPATRTQLVWDAPFGRGFPGWHIECTAMLLRFLGDQVDIHTGGIDLRFPHHEDERAQTESLVGREVVRHWVHAEHLLFEGRKMSKSAGNVVLLNDVLERGFDPRALRLAFLEQHYRSQVDMSWESIAAAHRLVQRWRAMVASTQGARAASPTAPSDSAQPATANRASEIEHSTAHADSDVFAHVLEAFEDDLNTAYAVRYLRQWERESSAPLEIKAATLLACDELLGLNLAAPALEIEIPHEIQHLATARELARANRDWKQSDSLRDELLNRGWLVTDSANGQRLSPRQR